MVNRDGAVPLYHQIYLQLRDEILSGERPFGSSLPTEEELAEIYQVSRITTRRVLNDLALHHFVERKRRLGTRVTFRSPAKPIEGNIEQAVDSLMALGEGTTVNVIEVSAEPASVNVANTLRIAPGTTVIRAVRVRSLDGEPLGYVVSYVPEALVDVVTEENLVRAPILKLLEEAGFHAEHADQTIGAIQADTHLAEALCIEPRAALLRISRTVYDANDVPFLITFAHYRSDRFHIRIDLQGGKTSRVNPAPRFQADELSS